MLNEVVNNYRGTDRKDEGASNVSNGTPHFHIQDFPKELPGKSVAEFCEGEPHNASATVFPSIGSATETASF
jgi:hypothetical protein